MISMNNKYFTEEQLTDILKQIEDDAVTPQKQEYFRVYNDYINQCLSIDNSLQNDVHKNIGTNFISIVILPFDEIDDFNSIDFNLINKKGLPLKKRERLIFKHFCQQYEENFHGLQEMLEQ